MKNAGHGLNPGRRYWCHASDSLTEPSGPAASQQAHIPISLHHEPKFSQDCHQAIPSHSRFSHPVRVEMREARVAWWQSCENLGSWWREIGMCLQLALMAQSGSHWHDTSSSVQGSSHGRHFSSLYFSLLSLQYLSCHVKIPRTGLHSTVG